MTQGIIRYILFLLAYAPIYIIVALKTVDNQTLDKSGQSITKYQILLNNIFPISLIIFTIILILYFKLYSKFNLKPKGNPLFTIKSIKSQHKEYITYLGTYILPFISLETNTVFDVIAFIFMFLTIGFIFSKTTLIYTNPTLAFFGYDIYEIETDDGNTYDCITRDRFSAKDRPSGIKLGDNTFIISQWKRIDL
jgi:hypothetical protein